MVLTKDFRNSFENLCYKAASSKKQYTLKLKIMHDFTNAENFTVKKYYTIFSIPLNLNS